MNRSKSPRTLSSVLLAAALAGIAAAGCITNPAPIPPETVVAQVSVQPGTPMTSVPGSGVGLFVQYDAGGHWRISTTCDTSVTGAACTFDVTVTPGAGVTISNVAGVDLQPLDTLSQGIDGTITFLAATRLGMDGISFDTAPGATIQVAMLLDGLQQPTDMYVLGAGGLLTGVPTNPVDLRPATP
jgi:hypothetical protein